VIRECLIEPQSGFHVDTDEKLTVTVKRFHGGNCLLRALHRHVALQRVGYSNSNL
jgi:hypothetical protein